MERITADQLKKIRRKKPVDREGPIQEAIVDWLRETFPDAITHHCKNEIKKRGNQFAREIAQAKRRGMVVGFPDIIFLPYAHKLNAMFFEVKAEGNYASKPQKEVHAQMGHLGYRVAVVRSVQDVRESLSSWGVGWAEKLPVLGAVGEGET